MLNDLRYAVRVLRRKPGFAVAAIVSIAFGLGANTSIFSFADGIFFHPLPVPNASGVVTLREVTPGRSALGGSISWRDYVDFRDHLRSFSGLVACQPAEFGFAASTGDQPRLESGALVSGNFFGVLGVEPRIGRGFRAEEDRVSGRDAVVVLGHRFWESEFASDPTIIGRQVRINAITFTVIGVADESFKGIIEFTNPAVYIPAAMGPALSGANHNLLTARNERRFIVKGRLKPEVSIAAASAEASSLAKALEERNPETNRGYSAVVRTEMQARDDAAPGRAVVPVLLFAIVEILLAIACANVANLMLSRARSRSREMAVRMAIGASRLQLLRQLMTESLIVALAGGALGLLIAKFFVTAVSKVQLPTDIPLDLNFQLNMRALWFTAAVSVASALLFGLAPALECLRTDLVPSLKSGEGDNARRRWFGRGALVVVQVSGSLVLLVLAAQSYSGLSHDIRRNLGFRTDHVLMMSFDTSLVRDTPSRRDQFYQLLAQRARETPGVRAVALASTIPTGVTPAFEQVIPERYQFPPGQQSVSVWTNVVDQNYFRVLGVPVIRGREFLPSDGPEAQPVAIVNDTFARRLLKNQPLGKRIRLGPNSPWIEVVGVTATGKYLSPLESPMEALYLPLRQRPESHITMLALTATNPSNLAAPLADVVRSIDPNMPVFGMRSMSDYFEQRSVKTGNLVVETIAGAGLLGFVLALVGLYAVVAWHVAGRRREIGVRIAIGADMGKIVLMILAQSARMSVTGIVLGIALAALIGHRLSSSPLHLEINYLWMAAIALALLTTSLIAAAIPARRASRIDPARALRQE